MSQKTLLGLSPPTPHDKTLSELDAELQEEGRELPFMLDTERLRHPMLPLISSGVFPMQPLPPVPKTRARWWPVALLVCAIALVVLAVAS